MAQWEKMLAVKPHTQVQLLEFTWWNSILGLSSDLYVSYGMHGSPVNKQI